METRYICLSLRPKASCGKGEIYDGSFEGALTVGNGVCAELLIQNDVSVYTENEIVELI